MANTLKGIDLGTPVLILKHGKEEDLPKLKLGELAFSYNNGGKLWIGGAGGNIPIGGGDGIGDMLKRVYDKDNNGIVDNAEELGGRAASEYMLKEVYDADGLGTVDLAKKANNADKLGNQPASYYASKRSVQDANDSIAALETAVYIPAGAIMPYAGNTIPKGWLLCDGSRYAVSEYPELAAVCRNFFGGDLATYFNVPKLQGRVVAMTDDSHAIGTVHGKGEQTLTAANLPAHSHTIRTNYTSSASHTHSGKDTGPDSAVATGITNGAPAVSMRTDNTGKGTPFSVYQPTFYLNYIIKY